MEEVEDIGYFDEHNKFYKTNTTNKVPFHENKIPVPKKKISYDDLLSSMGMKIVNGKLELYNKNLIGRPPPPTRPTPKNYEDYRYQQNRKYPIQNTNQPSFQNTNQPSFQNTHPMTEQQYKKHLQLEYLKNQYERRRVNEIKSKKILFTNPNALVNIKSYNNLNKMFHFVR
jgi:hypothetical protein